MSTIFLAYCQWAALPLLVQFNIERYALADTSLPFVAILDLIATITDPEHPVSLGQLSVINLPDIKITPSPALGLPDTNKIVQVFVEITPTITHCSLATVLGLAVRVRLEQALPPNYRVDVRCKENSHTQDDQVNKQLADKERVAAALENDNLKSVLDTMLASCV